MAKGKRGGNAHDRAMQAARTTKPPTVANISEPLVLPTSLPSTLGHRLWEVVESSLFLAALGIIVTVVVTAMLGGILRGLLVFAWVLCWASIHRSKLFTAYAGWERYGREVLVSSFLGMCLLLLGYFVRPPEAITITQISPWSLPSAHPHPPEKTRNRPTTTLRKNV